MERDDVLRMARDVYGPHEFSEGGLVLLERFAALVAEHCAGICDSLQDKEEERRAELRVREAMAGGDQDEMLAAMKHESNVSLYNAGIGNCATAIRESIK